MGEWESGIYRERGMTHGEMGVWYIYRERHDTWGNGSLAYIEKEAYTLGNGSLV